MKKTLLILFVIADLLLIIQGCVPSQPTEDIELLPSERLINKLEANRRKIKNFEGSGTIYVKTEQLENSANFRVVLQKPDSIYLTFLGPFGIELAQALVTPQSYIFYDALENTAYEGSADSDILKRIFKINLTFEDLMDAFVGSVNLTNNLYRPPSKYVIDYDKYVLTYIDSVRNLTTTYRVDIRQLGITDYRLDSFDGSMAIEGHYSKFELLETVAVPYKIKIKNENEYQQVEIDYKKIVANKNNISIDFKIPDDATVIKW